MGGRKLDHDRVMVTVPTSKVDVFREVDVIEEILRIYGFDNVSLPEKINSSVAYSQSPNRQHIKNKIAETLTALGFFEMMGLSLLESKLCKDLLLISDNELVLINNTSNVSLDAMRPDMMVSGLKSVTHNQNRQQTDIKLFEFGKTYRKNSDTF
ncbi:MAG TPA: phenylalanine--tRNA ligase subunit beta, partial [Saprospiraceae bacterium]|nr:phenylalanine--tRNA ligase subunit beta [Saprospiraceae bacterium]